MISMEVLVGWGVTGVTIIGHIFVVNYRIERNEKEQEKSSLKFEKDVEDVWRWKTGHEKETNDVREKYQNQLSELKGSQLVVGEQFRQIMDVLTDIKDRLSDLENNKNHHN